MNKLAGYLGLHARLNGSLKENRIESSMQGVTLKVVTLL
ncbi:hypothetical protein CRUP_017940, partial [Coryphaenoides rupestris]